MKDIKPNYYRRTIKGVEIDVNDIADAFDLGYQAQNAIKYLVRAGRKDETKLVDDLIKARHYIDRLIKKHEESEAKANEVVLQKEFTFEGVRKAVDDYVKDLGPLVQETNPETIACPQGDPACCGQVHDACAPLAATPEPSGLSPAAVKAMLDEVRKPVVLAATPEPAVATVWPFWVFRRRAPRDYTIAGPYPTRDAARRALDPGRSDERVVMADDPYMVPPDVVERLFA